ncbi:hypothetical protein ACFPK5_00305 [Streptomyces beijiangensis]|uniref:hypothetical protein n=1 Tax=Streptomyces beijiangensis TaxID=163361 RepID=UPI0031DBF693
MSTAPIASVHRDPEPPTEQVPPPAAPYFDFRAGGWRLTGQRIPYRLLTMATSVAAMVTGWWAR